MTHRLIGSYAPQRRSDANRPPNYRLALGGSRRARRRVTAEGPTRPVPEAVANLPAGRSTEVGRTTGKREPRGVSSSRTGGPSQAFSSSPSLQFGTVDVLGAVVIRSDVSSAWPRSPCWRLRSATEAPGCAGGFRSSGLPTSARWWASPLHRRPSARAWSAWRSTGTASCSAS